jgi:hypothetical protein
MIKMVDWNDLLEQFHKDLCRVNYTRNGRFELATDNPNEVFNWFKDKLKIRPITQKERDKGRSEHYWGMTAREQWDEDKKLGILDWDGN